MFFKTQTGSVYEVDEQNKRIRRLSGLRSATPRVGDDGNWKPVIAVTQLDLISSIKVGQPALIQWTSEVKPLTILGGFPGTITSPITEIINGNVFIEKIRSSDQACS